MNTFPERLGIQKLVVIDEAPSWLRSSYFNTVLDIFLHLDRNESGWSSGSAESSRPIGVKSFIEQIGIRTQRDIDRNYSDSYASYDVLQKLLQSFTWTEFYEVVELAFSILALAGGRSRGSTSHYLLLLNTLFVDARVAWEMNTHGMLVRTLPSEVMLAEVELGSTEAINSPVKVHLSKARRFLDSKPCDAANAIKECVMGVESYARSVDPENTLGSVLKLWKIKRPDLPPLLISVVEKMYAFASDEAGVRHGSPDDQRLIRADAEFVYASTLAILRYLPLATRRT